MLRVRCSDTLCLSADRQFLQEAPDGLLSKLAFRVLDPPQTASIKQGISL